MKRFFNIIEKYLIRFVVLGLVTIVLAQALMTHYPIRLYLSWGERMEGQVINFPVSVNNTPTDSESTPVSEEVTSPYALITISIKEFSSLPRAYVMINDEKIESFNTNEIKLNVMAGDVIKINSTSYNFPIDYKITSISNNLAYPELDQTFTANQSILMVGKVVVK